MIIKNGIVADPASGLYEQMDILVKDGKIVRRNNRCIRNDCRTWTYRHTCAFP